MVLGGVRDDGGDLLSESVDDFRGHGISEEWSMCVMLSKALSVKNCRGTYRMMSESITVDGKKAM